MIAVAILAAGAGVAWLAARNNPGSEVGYGVGAIAAIAAGASLAPSGRVCDLLGRQGVGLRALHLWLYAAPLATASVGGMMIGLVSGLGPLAGARIALGAGTGLGVLSWFLFLEHLIWSDRSAALAVSLEIVSALILASVEVSLSVLWFLARGTLLVRAAGRRRWLDR